LGTAPAITKQLSYAVAMNGYVYKYLDQNTEYEALHTDQNTEYTEKYT
jgi:hypothetical protein